MHPKVLECAVVGVPDIDWGQRVAAIMTCTKGKVFIVYFIFTKKWIPTFRFGIPILAYF